ncbi:LAME_0F11782g1_1 [Lachancea meyersii CBS 8951]|uniref:LAME_0F11782g1_1 n=1 Tax=Lachancea meyersii CBS 8951 TaxID=1266667 RepID=A0A1G4JW96_9SACH|nr:LAME_0F11782g1_1 [Lachancea meyersii CBS 8951]
MIDIKPSVLEYKPPLTAQATEYVTVTNNSDQAVAFKVKTTAPKFYCVRPNAALVQPGEQVQVQVILLGLAEEPAADFKCRDKFLVITLPAPYDLGSLSVTEAWPQLEAEFKENAVSKKIKVKYLLGDEAPAQESNAAAATAETVEDAPAKPQVSEKDIDDVVKPEKQPLATETLSEATKKDMTSGSKETPVDEGKQDGLDSTSGVAGMVSPAKQETALNPGMILLVALIALVLGWMYY